MHYIELYDHRNKPKSEMSEEEMRKKEEEEFQTGPLSVLTQAVKHNTQVWVWVCACACGCVCMCVYIHCFYTRFS